MADAPTRRFPAITYFIRDRIRVRGFTDPFRVITASGDQLRVQSEGSDGEFNVTTDQVLGRVGAMPITAGDAETRNLLRQLLRQVEAGIVTDADREDATKPPMLVR